MQFEDEPTIVAVDELPPTVIGDALVLVGVGRVIEVVIVDRDREPVVSDVGWQASRYRPRPQNAVLLEPKVEVRSGLSVIVQYEDRRCSHASYCARRVADLETLHVRQGRRSEPSGSSASSLGGAATSHGRR